MYKFDSVTSLNNYVSDLLTSDPNLGFFELTAEISDFTVAKSNHCYFRLKDKTAVVSCIMLSNYFSKVDFKPAVGDKVTIKGSVAIYSPSGTYQIKVLSMTKDGTGDLYERYRLLFAKLKAEGLFDASHKKKIPVLPRKIGVVTSSSGAVIHDIIDTLNRRNPHYHIVLYPAAVQGASCPEEISAGLNYFEQTHDVDVVIVARGGGSFEDLFGFNDETIARTIYNMTIPVISAIGHEVDYTICDYVADLRAPTPTAAAELVLNKYSDLSDLVMNTSMNLDIAIAKYIDSRSQLVANYANHKALARPLFYAKQQIEAVNAMEEKIRILMNTRLKSESLKLEASVSTLKTLNPENVLKRGYSFISNADGVAVESVNGINVGDEVIIRFVDGEARANVSDKKELLNNEVEDHG